MVSTALLRGPANFKLAEFIGSMPAAYALAFSTTESAEHSEIATRRRGRPVHVERWRTLPDQTTVICVIADDRAGLLSLICHVLVRLRLEIVSAQIYSRQALDGTEEAFDFFWVRARAAGEPRATTPAEVAELERELGELLALSPMACPDVPQSTHPSIDPIPAPRAFFDSTLLAGGKYMLVVESQDYPGLLLTITQALHRQGVEVLSSDVTTQGWLARDRFLLRNPADAGFSPERLAAIRAAVVSAVRLGVARLREG